MNPVFTDYRINQKLEKTIVRGANWYIKFSIYLLFVIPTVIFYYLPKQWLFFWLPEPVYLTVVFILTIAALIATYFAMMKYGLTLFGVRIFTIDKKKNELISHLDSFQTKLEDIQALSIIEVSDQQEKRYQLVLQLTNGEKTLPFTFTSFTKLDELLKEVEKALNDSKGDHKNTLEQKASNSAGKKLNKQLLALLLFPFVCMLFAPLLFVRLLLLDRYGLLADLIILIECISLLLVYIGIIFLWQRKKLGVYVYCISLTLYIILPIVMSPLIDPYWSPEIVPKMIGIAVSSGFVVYLLYRTKWQKLDSVKSTLSKNKTLTTVSICCFIIIGWSVGAFFIAPLQWQKYTNKHSKYLPFEVEIPGSWRAETVGGVYEFSDGPMIYAGDSKIIISIVSSDSKTGEEFKTTMERLRNGKYRVTDHADSNDHKASRYTYISPRTWNGNKGYSACEVHGSDTRFEEDKYYCRHIKVRHGNFIVSIYENEYYGTYKSNEKDYYNHYFKDDAEAEKIYNRFLSTFKILEK